MSDILEKMRTEIANRITQYEKSDENHADEIKTLESELKTKTEKRKKVQGLIEVAYKELEEVNQFIEWKKTK